mmetsp:Transcript_33843/g.60701  ORF Transcript_33843/g.60701 Transcript_33843/m.60701 type:complete len:479 (-) Transcript_33843:459-1895(-)
MYWTQFRPLFLLVTCGVWLGHGASISLFPNSTLVDDGVFDYPLRVCPEYSVDLTDMSFGVNLTHSDRSKLQITLIAPSGMEMLCFDQVWDDGPGFNLIFKDSASLKPSQVECAEGTICTGTFQCEKGNLSAFSENTTNLNGGLWVIRIADIPSEEVNEEPYEEPYEEGPLRESSSLRGSGIIESYTFNLPQMSSLQSTCTPTATQTQTPTPTPTPPAVSIGLGELALFSDAERAWFAASYFNTTWTDSSNSTKTVVYVRVSESPSITLQVPAGNSAGAADTINIVSWGPGVELAVVQVLAASAFASVGIPSSSSVSQTVPAFLFQVDRMTGNGTMMNSVPFTFVVPSNGNPRLAVISYVTKSSNATAAGMENVEDAGGSITLSGDGATFMVRVQHTSAFAGGYFSRNPEWAWSLLFLLLLVPAGLAALWYKHRRQQPVVVCEGDLVMQPEFYLNAMTLPTPSTSIPDVEFVSSTISNY